ncbi:hypothetical protein G4B84_003896 [Aspergillus flavus NRRL3357]|nr:uncharacterized protein G4B84_003896 [Aspergillus flavus NRRL3357]QMW28607.1 hypothetical protein G4B84_003896 [Aspergillus flavus NRRL3357]
MAEAHRTIIVEDLLLSFFRDYLKVLCLKQFQLVLKPGGVKMGMTSILQGHWADPNKTILASETFTLLGEGVYVEYVSSPAKKVDSIPSQLELGSSCGFKSIDSGSLREVDTVIGNAKFSQCQIQTESQSTLFQSPVTDLSIETRSLSRNSPEFGSPRTIKPRRICKSHETVWVYWTFKPSNPEKPGVQFSPGDTELLAYMAKWYRYPSLLYTILWPLINYGVSRLRRVFIAKTDYYQSPTVSMVNKNHSDDAISLSEEAEHFVERDGSSTFDLWQGAFYAWYPTLTPHDVVLHSAVIFLVLGVNLPFEESWR